tara:strand:+ start:2953 stop:3081 length:129 start_codon:yes stop_codon:yes gene_type:complete
VALTANKYNPEKIDTTNVRIATGKLNSLNEFEVVSKILVALV